MKGFTYMIFSSKYDYIQTLIKFGLEKYPNLVPKYNGFIIVLFRDDLPVIEKLDKLFRKYYNNTSVMILR